MTRAEHYAMAEQLLAHVAATLPEGRSPEEIARALVHATLAAAGTDGAADFSTALAVDPFLTVTEREHIRQLWDKARLRALGG